MRYNAPTIRMACKGIDLKSAIDALGEGRYRILTNLVPTEEFGLVSIPGTRKVNSTALGSVALHSLGFLNAPTSTSRLLAGAGTALYDVNSLASLASGFSGNPLSMVPYRLSGAGLPWMIVGDSNKMVKVSPSGQVYQLGITPPAAASTTSLGSPFSLTVQTFNTDSGFTYFSGGAVPAPSHTVIAGQVGNAIQMTTTCSTELGYFGISEALTINMNSFGSGDPAIQDTDYISLWVKVSDPTLIQEIRILFDLDSGLGFNQNFYFASVRTSDIQQALEYQTTINDTSVGASMNIRTQAMLEGLPSGITVPYQPGTLLNEQVSAGQNQWTKITLTRGSFQRVGGDSTLNWSNVKGISVAAVTTAELGAPSVSVAVNNLIVFGGYEINASLGVPYDWRYTYQDSVTLSESNPSPIQASGAFLSPQVTPVTVTAARSADPQVNTIRFWRRGGTLGDNWYLVGTAANPGSGSASITDGAGDSTIASAAILSITNDQPFTTLGASGSVTLGTPLPCLFGPYNGNVIFAVGDPNNPGFLYWCNAANPDAAASTQNVEVSQSSDPLMNGCIWDNQPFVATGTTWYRIVPSQIGAPNQFQGLPTGAQHGLPKGANWAFIPTPVGIAYASNDGVYLMANGPEQMLGALDLWPLFNGEAKEIYQPIDFTHPEKIRFAFFDSEIWFGYQDTAAQQNWWTFHVFKKDGWKNRQYPWNPAVVYGEPEQQDQSLLLGGNNGIVYIQDYTLATNDGAAIAGHIRTGSFNFGAPHSEKEFGGLVVDANTSGANLAVYTLFGYEGTTQSLGNVAVGSRQAIPLKIADTYSTDCVIDLQFTSTVQVSVYSATLLWRPDAVPVVHWESQPEGFGIGGWAHCYDSYITVRSTSNITLTLEVDGEDIPTVTLPSTGGARSKLYVQWPLNKGKVFRPIADSSAPFRLYLEDTFFNFTAWNGGSPTQLQPLGGIYPGEQ